MVRRTFPHKFSDSDPTLATSGAVVYAWEGTKYGADFRGAAVPAGESGRRTLGRPWTCGTQCRDFRAFLVLVAFSDVKRWPGDEFWCNFEQKLP